MALSYTGSTSLGSLNSLNPTVSGASASPGLARTDFNALSQALSAGDISGARNAFGAFQADLQKALNASGGGHHRHGGDLLRSLFGTTGGDASQNSANALGLPTGIAGAAGLSSGAAGTSTDPASDPATAAAAAGAASSSLAALLQQIGTGSLFGAQGSAATNGLSGIGGLSGTNGMNGANGGMSALQTDMNQLADAINRKDNGAMQVAVAAVQRDFQNMALGTMSGMFGNGAASGTTGSNSFNPLSVLGLGASGANPSTTAAALKYSAMMGLALA